ncbi:YhcN/YlaJ family sporulation lipoprotein [Paenibacillus arenosi]|uniref:YhcN/YlaJ family sporulation lipoprotein n=1 Tax=Paenibacillus arenosi TaxID=2774142 RepID=A0ABR9B1M4_9BACL|nr:YhcN/YlaJ family sporulation lipoprotein [Paenibacillus arenosi]MBD8500282.1 YhcN/YlaJ family sporulation lipoprotein [Paenibacillus arenosi]
MRMKAALLTMTAAMVMMTGLTGCYNNGTTTKGAYPNTTSNYQNGMAPYGTSGTNGYGYPNGYGTPYNTDGNYYRNYNNYNRNDGISGYGYNGYNHGYRSNNTNRNMPYTGQNMSLSQKAADKVAAIPGVHRAYVVQSNDSAYVAVTTASTHRNGSVNKANTGNKALSKDLKSKIAHEVKKASPNVKNVYVSEDPNFVDRMSQYAEHVKAGHPFQGFAVEFNEMTRRIFPTNAGHAVK